jgi:serine/threonine protein kinase
MYRRLQTQEDNRSSGIVRFIYSSPESTQLAYMANGDLRAYLIKCRPSPQLQLTWFRDMASTLSYIHERRVLITDIASRSFLHHCIMMKVYRRQKDVDEPGEAFF